jgi:hypothetical protein
MHCIESNSLADQGHVILPGRDKLLSLIQSTASPMKPDYRRVVRLYLEWQTERSVSKDSEFKFRIK